MVLENFNYLINLTFFVRSWNLVARQNKSVNSNTEGTTLSSPGPQFICEQNWATTFNRHQAPNPKCGEFYLTDISII